MAKIAICRQISPFFDKQICYKVTEFGGDFIKDYEINEETLALVALDHENTKVYELDDEFIVNEQANKIMENSCSYFGSSLDGRQKGTQALLGITHKAPVIVEETRNIIFFPTSSPRLKNCSWISLNNLEKAIKKDGKSSILFKNNKEVNINISTGIINNQILRATRLESVLRKRKKD